MGKHSDTSTISRTAGRMAAVAAATVAIPAAVTVGAGEAHAAPNWDPIIQCESGGNPRAQNPVSTASGLFQFIDGTWKAYGGSTAKAKHASVEEQYRVANRAYAAEGYNPWNASKSCWGPKMSGGSTSSTPVVKETTQREAPKTETKKAEPVKKVEEKKEPVKPKAEAKVEKTTEKTVKVEKQAPKPVAVVPEGASYTPGGDGLYTVKAGDTLSHLAAENNTTVQALMDLNKDILEMPDWIFEGEKIHLK